MVSLDHPLAQAALSARTNKHPAGAEVGTPIIRAGVERHAVLPQPEFGAGLQISLHGFNDAINCRGLP